MVFVWKWFHGRFAPVLWFQSSLKVRIHIKMLRIRNTALLTTSSLYLLFNYGRYFLVVLLIYPSCICINVIVEKMRQTKEKEVVLAATVLRIQCGTVSIYYSSVSDV